MGYEDWTVQSRANGQLGITLLVHKRAAADALATAKRIKAFIAAARPSLAPGVTLIFGATEGRNPAWALVKVFMQPEGVRRTDSNVAMAELRQKVKGLEGFKSIILEPLKDTPVAGKPVQVEVIGNDDSRFELARHPVGYLKARLTTRAFDHSSLR